MRVSFIDFLDKRCSAKSQWCFFFNRFSTALAVRYLHTRSLLSRGLSNLSGLNLFPSGKFSIPKDFSRVYTAPRTETKERFRVFVVLRRYNIPRRLLFRFRFRSYSRTFTHTYTTHVYELMFGSTVDIHLIRVGSHGGDNQISAIRYFDFRFRIF